MILQQIIGTIHNYQQVAIVDDVYSRFFTPRLIHKAIINGSSSSGSDDDIRVLMICVDRTVAQYQKRYQKCTAKVQYIDPFQFSTSHDNGSAVSSAADHSSLFHTIQSSVAALENILLIIDSVSSLCARYSVHETLTFLRMLRTLPVSLLKW